jgi:hypothetical protein
MVKLTPEEAPVPTCILLPPGEISKWIGSNGAAMHEQIWCELCFRVA